MYSIIDGDGNIYTQYKYESEPEYERVIVANTSAIFGADGIFFDIKKLIGTRKKGATIPDGYYLDLTFHNDPKLYLVEVELSGHDVYSHIGVQIFHFGISTEADKYKIKSILLKNIGEDASKKEKIAAYLKKSKLDNVNELLDKVIFDNAPAAIIVIDEATEELSLVMAQLTMATDVIEAQTYVCGGKRLHRFRQFKDEIYADLTANEDADELDTIVVPARKDGFESELLGHSCWFEIRIASAMLDKIKYIAAYQVSPVSGVTYVAQVERIEKYKDTNKYILYFRQGTTEKIEAVGLGDKKGLAPQGPRYTSLKRLRKAKTLDDIWG